MTTCAETDCPFRTFGGWCGLTACIRRNTTTEIGANPGWVIPEDYVKVVRCRDCKYSDVIYDTTSDTMPLKCLNIRYGGVRPEWFCEHGERRDEGADN